VTQEIRSNKVAIVGQSLAIFIACAGTGAALEYFDLLETSPLGRLSATLGLPVGGAALGFVGFTIAIATAIDNWAFSVRVGETGLEIVERLGKTQIRYANIEALKLIPAYGAGIALKDKNEWLNAFAGSVSNREKLARISAVLAATYGCDIAFVNKRLKCGSQAFLDLLSLKTGLPISSNTPAA
jgi:hypothetical protein